MKRPVKHFIAIDSVKINLLLNGKSVWLSYLHAVKDNMTTQRLKRHRKNSKERHWVPDMPSNYDLLNRDLQWPLIQIKFFYKVINRLLNVLSNWHLIYTSRGTHCLLISSLHASHVVKISKGNVFLSMYKSHVKWHSIQ